MLMTPETKKVSIEDRVKNPLPFEWGYGSTPRTKKLRDALYWKASVATNELQDEAMGLPKVTFRPGVRIDMDRARIVTETFRETAGQPIVLKHARMVERLCDEMPIFILDGELIVGDPNGGAEKVRWYPEMNVNWMPAAVTTEPGLSEIVTDEERKEILEDICPYWMERSMAGLIQSSLPDELEPQIMNLGSFTCNVWQEGRHFTG